MTQIVVAGYPNCTVDLFRVSYLPSIGLTAHHPDVKRALYTHEWCTTRPIYSKMLRSYSEIRITDQSGHMYESSYRDSLNYESPVTKIYDPVASVHEVFDDAVLMIPCNLFIGRKLPLDLVEHQDLTIFVDSNGELIPSMVGMTQYGKRYFDAAVRIILDRPAFFEKLYGTGDVASNAIRLITGGIRNMDNLIITSIGPEFRFNHATTDWLLGHTAVAGTQRVDPSAFTGDICYVSNVLSIQERIRE